MKDFTQTTRVTKVTQTINVEEWLRSILPEGSAIEGGAIHDGRLMVTISAPLPEGADSMILDETGVLHIERTLPYEVERHAIMAARPQSRLFEDGVGPAPLSQFFTMISGLPAAKLKEDRRLWKNFQDVFDRKFPHLAGRLRSRKVNDGEIKKYGLSPKANVYWLKPLNEDEDEVELYLAGTPAMRTNEFLQLVTGENIDHTKTSVGLSLRQRFDKTFPHLAGRLCDRKPSKSEKKRLGISNNRARLYWLRPVGVELFERGTPPLPTGKFLELLKVEHTPENLHKVKRNFDESFPEFAGRLRSRNPNKEEQEGFEIGGNQLVYWLTPINVK